MKKKTLTPIEETQRFASNLVASLRLHHTLKELDKLTEEERATPENQVIIELLIKAIMMTNKDNPIEA